MNDYQSLFNILLGAILCAMGWYSRQLWDAVKELKQDIADIRVEIAKDYTPRNDFKDFASEIRAMFEIIRSKLEDKADK